MEGGLGGARPGGLNGRSAWAGGRWRACSDTGEAAAGGTGGDAEAGLSSVGVVPALAAGWEQRTRQGHRRGCGESGGQDGLGKRAAPWKASPARRREPHGAPRHHRRFRRDPACLSAWPRLVAVTVSRPWQARVEPSVLNAANIRRPVESFNTRYMGLPCTAPRGAPAAERTERSVADEVPTQVEGTIRGCRWQTQPSSSLTKQPVDGIPRVSLQVERPRQRSTLPSPPCPSSPGDLARP